MGGMGTEYFPGDIISTTMTLYVYAGTPGCSAETDFDITISTLVTVDEFEDIRSCKNFALPELSNGRYFTQPLGQGTELFPYEVISNTQTIYVYNELGVCAAESNFTVTIDCNPSEATTCLSFPNFFTPNHDGIHDYFMAHSDSDCSANGTVSVYNRYGKLIKQFNTANDHWDGTYNGIDVPSTDYWYHYIDNENGAIVKGHFSLKR